MINTYYGNTLSTDGDGNVRFYKISYNPDGHVNNHENKEENETQYIEWSWPSSLLGVLHHRKKPLRLFVLQDLSSEIDVTLIKTNNIKNTHAAVLTPDKTSSMISKLILKKNNSLKLVVRKDPKKNPFDKVFGFNENANLKKETINKVCVYDPWNSPTPIRRYETQDTEKIDSLIKILFNVYFFGPEAEKTIQDWQNSLTR
jgi:hypothetical protein